MSVRAMWIAVALAAIGGIAAAAWLFAQVAG